MNGSSWGVHLWSGAAYHQCAGWLNTELLAKLRIETKISSCSIATLLL